jgi:O-methyltransferase
MRKYSMKKIIVFGAATGGQKIIREFEMHSESFHVIAYADNDPKLQGTSLFGKPVIKPSDINNFSFDGIIIASTARDNIYKQLVDELGIDSFKILKYDSFRHLAKHAAIKNMAQLIYENNISGNVAEVGVYQGESAKLINKYFPDRILYLFDTFEGFVDADIKREIEIGTDWITKRSYLLSDDTSIDIVLEKMSNPEMCVIKKGYFPKTAEGLEDVFSFVSIDVDLYQPTLEALKYFYSRLSGGGA